MFKRSLFLFLIVLLFSCGKTADQKTADAVLSANIALSKGNCQQAINTLEENGRVNTNAAYLKTLASAYACRAGYSTLTFFTTDLALTATPAPLGGTTIYTTSQVTNTSPFISDSKFSDIQTAINILLYAGGISSTTEPTSAERAKYFTTSEAADIDSQLLYLLFVQLGKFMHVYGNGNAAGLKGAGSAGNSCFTSYKEAIDLNDVEVTAMIGTLPAACQGVVGSSHSQLATTVAAATRKKRLCQGVVILNGILNVLPAVAASATGNLGTTVTAANAAASAASTAMNAAYPVGTVSSTINQTTCEDDAAVPVANLETYYAFMYEQMFQP